MEANVSRKQFAISFVKLYIPLTFLVAMIAIGVPSAVYVMTHECDSSAHAALPMAFCVLVMILGIQWLIDLDKKKAALIQQYRKR